MDINKDKLLEIARKIESEADIKEHQGQISLSISKEKLIVITKEMKDHPELAFDMLIDVTAIDWLRKKKSFRNGLFPLFKQI